MTALFLDMMAWSYGELVFVYNNDRILDNLIVFKYYNYQLDPRRAMCPTITLVKSSKSRGFNCFFPVGGFEFKAPSLYTFDSFAKLADACKCGSSKGMSSPFMMALT
jgi:hypothetical protein